MDRRKKPEPVTPITRKWRTLRGEDSAALYSRDGEAGILEASLNGQITRWNVTSAEAVAEFKARVAQESGDFDGEANFGDWLLYNFVERSDVRIRV